MINIKLKAIMKKKEPNFKWWQRLIFKYFGVRRVDILKLALAQFEFHYKLDDTVCYLCPLIYFILADLGMVDYKENTQHGLFVHQYIPKFESPHEFRYWSIPWWGSRNYRARKEFLQELIKEYKNDKKRFQINVYNHG